MNILEKYEDLLVRSKRPSIYEYPLEYYEVVDLPLQEKLEIIFDAENDYYDYKEKYLFGMKQLKKVIELFQSSSPELESLDRKSTRLNSSHH